MAVEIFMRLDGIQGEAPDPHGTHADSIQVVSWTWGMTQTGTAREGDAVGVVKANVHDLSFTKNVDFATPELMSHCCHGRPIHKALLTCRRAGPRDGAPPLEYMRIEFDDCLITSVSTGGGGAEGKLTEHVTLNFQSYQVTYTKQGHDDAPGASSRGEYRIAR
jgi:type VI secretion system secreted protein Hcp